MYAWQKGDELCQEEMEPDRPGRDVAVAGVWAALRERAEAAWVAHLPQGRGEIVSVQSAVKKCRTLLENHVVIKLVPSAGRE
jgi:hypothetical protein